MQYFFAVPFSALPQEVLASSQEVQDRIEAAREEGGTVVEFVIYYDYYGDGLDVDNIRLYTNKGNIPYHDFDSLGDPIPNYILEEMWDKYNLDEVLWEDARNTLADY
jgi:hypothetical protein